MRENEYLAEVEVIETSQSSVARLFLWIVRNLRTIYTFLECWVNKREQPQAAPACSPNMKNCCLQQQKRTFEKPWHNLE
jgi:hypothetical protein